MRFERGFGGRPGEEGEDEEGLPGDDAGEEGEGWAQRDQRIPHPRRHRHLLPPRVLPPAIEGREERPARLDSGPEWGLTRGERVPKQREIRQVHVTLRLYPRRPRAVMNSVFLKKKL
jgi:hypothetical protein